MWTQQGIVFGSLEEFLSLAPCGTHILSEPTFALTQSNGWDSWHETGSPTSDQTDRKCGDSWWNTHASRNTIGEKLDTWCTIKGKICFLWLVAAKIVVAEYIYLLNMDSLMCLHMFLAHEKFVQSTTCILIAVLRHGSEYVIIQVNGFYRGALLVFMGLKRLMSSNP